MGSSNARDEKNSANVGDYSMCDHLGEYFLFTRHVNKVPIRVYQCKACGQQMAMDTLPQNLLKRMWGNVERGSLPLHDLPPIDFCVIINGVNALQLCRVYFWSLFKTLSTAKGITFHLFNNYIPEDEFEHICELVPAKVHKYCLYRDVPLLKALEWVITNCGTNKFIAMSHFDVFFAKDYTNYLRAQITPKTGQLGSHCPFIILNRDAFEQSIMKFRLIGPFKVVPDGPNCDTYVTEDPRGANGLNQGFDCGDVLELELRTNGWHVDPMRGPGLGDEAAESWYHLVGGARVTPELNDGSEYVSIKRRAQMFIEEYQIP